MREVSTGICGQPAARTCSQRAELTATNTSKEIVGLLTPENHNCCVRQDMALHGSLMWPLSCVSCPCLQGTHHSKCQQELSKAAFWDAVLVKNGAGREGAEILGDLS